MPKKKLPNLEIILGIVSPLGSDKSLFKKKLREEFTQKGFDFVEIKVTDLLIDKIDKTIPKSLNYFIKMQICSELRSEYSNGILASLVIAKIHDHRNKIKNESNKKIIYYIDQLKNVAEYKILSHIYGLNYVQMSLFSNQIERDIFLKNEFKNTKIAKNVNKYKEACEKIITKMKIKLQENTKTFTSTLLKKYSDDILPDTSHRLMEKDFNESDDQFIGDGSGQQISKLFHRSHYFINLDLHEGDINKEIEKFINLLFGRNIEYPTQDEFGMCIAFQASVRSNFPGDRHVGAAILSEYGEVISVASIRAPSQKSSNPTLDDMLLIQRGYNVFHKKIDDWKSDLNTLIKNKTLSTESKNALSGIKDLIGGLLDFHPCTHAEIAAIIDAAKLGVSVRNSTLYTTTFPCHVCAKDIINAGIKRVVYLEAYPKSKIRELYPDLIDFDPKFESELIPFNFYWGVGPKRFIYVYSLENSVEKENCNPPLLRFEIPRYYEQREADVKEYLDSRRTGKKIQKKVMHLSHLLENKV